MLGHVAVGMARVRATTSSSPARRKGLARHLLQDRDGALTHERDWDGVGTHAVARDTTGGVGGVDHGEPGWLGSSPRRRSLVQRRLHRREANVEVRQTQPGTIQADNSFLLTAQLDAAGGVGDHRIYHAPHHGPAG